MADKALTKRRASATELESVVDVAVAVAIAADGSLANQLVLVCCSLSLLPMRNQ